MRYYKGDKVRLKWNGAEVEVLAATLCRVKVKVVLQDRYGPCGWKSEMYDYEDVEPAWEDLPGCSPESSRWWAK